MKRLILTSAALLALLTPALAAPLPGMLDGNAVDLSTMGVASVTAPPYNADRTGVADSTAAFQAAVNSGALAIFVPPGSYKACGVTLPTTAFIHVYGVGEGSKILQGGCGSAVFKWATGAMSWNPQTISDLYFNASNGNANTIDTTGNGSITIRNVYFDNTPTGFSNVYVNGTAATYTHDVRLIDIRAINLVGQNAGVAKVRFGALASDSSIDMMYSDGAFSDANAIRLESGSTDIQVSHVHAYNTVSSVVFNSGAYNAFVGDTFDFAQSAAIFRNSGAGHTHIVGGYIQGIQSGFSGISNTSSIITLIVGEKFLPVAGSVSAVVDDGASASTVVDDADIGTLANYSAVFNLQGTGSYAVHVPGYAPLGTFPAYSGTTTSAQAQNSTVWIGQNGQVANSGNNYLNTAFTVAYAQTITGASVATLNTPAAGQTFTFTLFDGVASLGSCTVNNGSFGCNITASFSGAALDSLYLQSVFSATSGSSQVRFTINARG